MRKKVARSKTRKGVAKRFKITGTGKILRRKQGRRHLAECKNRKRKRNLRKVTTVAAANRSWSFGEQGFPCPPKNLTHQHIHSKYISNAKPKQTLRD
jgi:large subunit ribosomal protein L35